MGQPDVFGGFALSAVFFVAFIVVESRSKTLLLQLDLFKGRAFAIAAIATVVGMAAMLGIAYSRWLTGIGFALLSIGAFWMAAVPAATLWIPAWSSWISPPRHRTNCG